MRIPTHRPRIRRFLGIRLFRTSAGRWQAVAARAAAVAREGRAVLVGTRSVQASLELGAVLEALGEPHSILNALQDSLEAAIVGEAGRPGRITVATNMAGRGTDVDLHPSVRAAGGLHVILSEFHESARVDRQLYGRAGRQGDPGSCEAMVALEDELFLQFAGPLVRLLRRFPGGGPELAPPWGGMLGRLLQECAQWRAERANLRVRLSAVERDDVMQNHTAFSGLER